MRPKVRIFFDGALSGAANALTLDDPIKGQLDDAGFPLADDFADVSDDVRSVRIRRGRSDETTSVDAGNATVTLDNRARIYDPTVSASISPYAGSILPRREITISLAEVPVFSGQVEDWDLQYSPSGDSVTIAKAADGFALLSQYAITASTGFTGPSGSVIYETASAVGWPVARAVLDYGTASVGAHTINAGQLALPYLQKIANTEQALLFIGKDGNLAYRDRVSPLVDSGTVFADDGTGIPFINIEIMFGTEFLYTQAVVNYPGGSASAVTASVNVENYGLTTYTLDTFLGDGAAVTGIAGFLAERYGEPTFRITSLDVNLDSLPPAQTAEMLNLELGHGVHVVFTPNGIGDPIVRDLAVDAIEHEIATGSHIVSLKFFEPFLTRRDGSVSGSSTNTGSVTGSAGFAGNTSGSSGITGGVAGSPGYAGTVTGSSDTAGTVVGTKTISFTLNTSTLDGPETLQ
jgi:hypothetical protein